MKPQRIRRAMLDEISRNGDRPDAGWAEYHRLRKLLARTCGCSLSQADAQARACRPDGTLSAQA